MAAILAFVTLLLVQLSAEYSLNRRISNGEGTERGQFDFMVSIQLILPKNKTTYVHVCGGVILDRFWILSSAICILNVRFIGGARVHIHMYYTSEADSAVQIINIARTHIHDGFNYSSNVKPNDLGLIMLESPITHYTPVKLPDPRNPETGHAIMIGWGRTSPALDGNQPKVMQHANVRVISNRRCQDLLPNRQLWDLHMCSQKFGQPITGCRGDAGGPLIRYVGGEPEVIGILSWILNPCGQVGAPTISTRVSHFNTWIGERIGKAANKMSDNDNLLTPLLVPQALI